MGCIPCRNYGLNYGEQDKGHRANGFTTDGGLSNLQSTILILS